MAKACLVNVNGYGEAMLAKMKSEGRIDEYWHVEGSATWCFTFSKPLEIDIEDYMEVAPDYVHNTNGKFKIFLDQFKRHVILAIVRSVKGAEIEELTQTHITLRPTEKEARVCLRMTPEQKQQLEEEAKREGLSLSEYIRRRLGLA